MANGISDLERGIASALPGSPSFTPEGILNFAKDNPATVATSALSLVDMAGGLGRLGSISTPIGILANIGKGLISGDARDFLPFGRKLFPTETERAMEESRSTPLGRAAIINDYIRNYMGDELDPRGLDPLVSPANQTPTTTGGLPPVSPVQTQPLGPPTPAPVGVASLGSPFAAPGVGIFGTPEYTDEADVFGESSPYGGMGAPDGGGNEDFGDEGYDYGEDI